jgi:hypothetical protein
MYFALRFRQNSKKATRKVWYSLCVAREWAAVGQNHGSVKRRQRDIAFVRVLGVQVLNQDIGGCQLRMLEISVGKNESIELA